MPMFHSEGTQSPKVNNSTHSYPLIIFRIPKMQTTYM
jgi:hypothetical protein